MAKISLTEFYTPYKLQQAAPAVIGFIDLADNWDEKALMQLREEHKLQALFGLEAMNNHICKLKSVDGVIVCPSIDAHIVMSIFESVLHQGATLEADLGEIKKAFSDHYFARFIKENTTQDKIDEPQSSATVINLLNQIPQLEKIKFMMLKMVSKEDLHIAEYNDMVTIIESRAYEDYGLFYEGDIVEHLDTCWMGAICIASAG